jgi:hypothetical protein
MANARTLVVNLPKDSSDAETADEEQALANSISRAPLFADMADHAGEVDHIIVERVGPVREGTLGKFEPDSTEEDLFNRYGGGKYRLSGRSARGQTVKGLFKTMEIAGEPIFLSEQARNAYARMSGQPRTAETPQGLGVEQLFALLSKQNETSDAAAQRREAEREQQHRRDLERIKAEADAQVQAREREDDRRRKDEADREAQRRKDADERDERRRRDDEAALARSQAFQATMLQIAQGNNRNAPDPTGLLLAGVELATKLRGDGGGGGESDPVAELVKNLPAIVDKISATVKGTSGAKPDELVLEGELGKKGQAAVAHLKAQGADPSSILAQAFDALLQMRAAPAAPSNGVRRGPGGRPIPTAPTPPAAQSAPAAAQPAQGAAQPAPTPPGPS